MRFGLALAQVGPFADPTSVTTMAEDAERRGYDALWVLGRLLPGCGRCEADREDRPSGPGCRGEELHQRPQLLESPGAQLEVDRGGVAVDGPAGRMAGLVAPDPEVLSDRVDMEGYEVGQVGRQLVLLRLEALAELADLALYCGRSSVPRNSVASAGGQPTGDGLGGVQHRLSGGHAGEHAGGT